MKQLTHCMVFHCVKRQYCLNLLANSGLLGCKPIGTQLEPGTHLLQDDSGSYPDIPAYRCLVGCLLYLTTTRPDISFATQQLSQFLSSPTMTHFQSAQRVLKYLKGSPGKGIMFSRSSSCSWWDSVMQTGGGCPDSHRSISGFLFLPPEFSCQLEFKEATHSSPLLLWSWVPRPCFCFLRTTMAQLLALRFTHHLWQACCCLLWQQKCPSHCSQPCLSWKNQALGHWLPCCEGTSLKWYDETTAYCFCWPTCGFVHQGFASKTVYVLSFKAGFGRYLPTLSLPRRGGGDNKHVIRTL